MSGLLDSVYTENLVSSLKMARKDFRIDMLDLSGSGIRRYKLNDYVDHLHLIEGNQSILAKIPKFRVIKKLRDLSRYAKNLPKYDILHVHFADRSWLLNVQALRKKYDRLLISIWGSDLYKASLVDRHFQKLLFSLADMISFGNPQTIEDFLGMYPRIPRSKLRLAYFGSPNIDLVRKMGNIDVSSYSSGLGIDEDLIPITIGYNNSEFQQHEKIIRSIESVGDRIPDNVLFLLPMTYGGNSKYREHIISLLKSTRFRWKVFDHFLTSEEISLMRLASKIMIQLQTTDSFSSSMRESLYAGEIVITGDWLPYGILDEKGVFMLKVSSVEEVGEKLVYALNNLDSLKEKCKKNPEIIWELSSWEKNIQSWIDMYEDLLQKER